MVAEAWASAPAWPRRLQLPSGLHLLALGETLGCHLWISLLKVFPWGFFGGAGKGDKWKDENEAATLSANRDQFPSCYMGRLLKIKLRVYSPRLTIKIAGTGQAIPITQRRELQIPGNHNRAPGTDKGQASIFQPNIHTETNVQNT